jgi:hypothetical protein
LEGVGYEVGVVVAAGRDEDLAWLEWGVTQSFVLVEIAAGSSHAGVATEHCPTDTGGGPDGENATGAQGADPWKGEAEDQHPAHEANDGSGPGPGLDIVEKVLGFVVFEHHRIAVPDGGAEMFAAQPDLSEIVDGSLGAVAISEDGADVIVVIMGGPVFG